MEELNVNFAIEQNEPLVADFEAFDEPPTVEVVNTDYEIMENKPSINDVELVGNKTANELGLALASEIPTLTSQLQNDSNYATQLDIMQAIATIPQFKFSIVSELPTTGEKMTFYLVPKEGTDNDVYNEYIWIDEIQVFEHIGTTAVDLTDYAEKFELTAPLQYVYDGNIGSAYLYNSTDENEITTNEVIGKSVQLLKSGSATTGEYSNFEPNKAWEVSVKKIVLNSLPSAYTQLLTIRRLNNGSATININESNQLAFYCNFGSATSTSATGIFLAVDTPYDLKISYDGAGKTILQYKLSSSPTWITGATRSSTLLANTGTGYNYVCVGSECSSFMLSNVEFINNGNVLFKHVAETTKYLSMALDENAVKVVNGKLTTSTKILVTTEADYEALETKEENTLYLIEE